MSSSKGWPMAQLWRRDDEEMAKKDDDHKLPRRGPASWAAARPPRPARLVRLVAFLAAAVAAALLLLRVAGLDRGSDPRPLGRGRPLPDLSSTAPNYAPPPRQRRPSKPPAPKIDAKTDRAGAQEARADQRRNYNEPVKLPKLVDSLQLVSAVGMGFFSNRNVLFAAASLQSAATLLPMACLMASEGHNRVHFAFSGRDGIPLKELLKLNGIDSACFLMLHDARPDDAATSTDQRMTLTVEHAIAMFHRTAHPQAILVDSTSTEAEYFLRGVRDQLKKTPSALIELPAKPQSRLAWITKLEASALAAWNKVRFDIVVHGPPTGTGNLKRLLRSLARADLGGHSTPHLVVELPPTVEEPLEKFLAGFTWPPPYPGDKPMPSMLSLRRRIPRQKLTEESSARFLESFWPSDPAHSHVLVLSPHMEVGPHFFHYVKYALLFQRHSRAAAWEVRQPKMMAMSFSIPKTVLGTAQSFAPPSLKRDDETASGGGTAFLWQAPTSDAVLWMGEKWVELHGYVSQVLERQHATSAAPALLATKELGKSYPAWMEYALQLARLRGYLTLYPSRSTADALGGVHTDLPDKPEEFQGHADTRDKDKDVLGDDASVVFDVGSQVDMLETLPPEAEQRLLDGLPILSWDGQQTGEDELENDAAQLVAQFRRQVGQCADESRERSVRADNHARDLFCKMDEDRGWRDGN